LNAERSQRRVALVIPSLEFGGAERVIVQMANHWADAGNEVAVITLASAAHDTYELSPRVKRIALDLMQVSGNSLSAVINNWRRIRELKRAIRDFAPDVVVSFTDRMNVVTLLAARGLQARVIVSERVDPSQHEMGSVWSRLRRWTYPRAAGIVVQTESVREQIAKFAGRAPIHVIPNAVDAPPQQAVERAAIVKSAAKPHVVAMGRLAVQKGFDHLIAAFARVAAEHPSWSLRILGEGPERSRLENQISELKLAGRVTLCGWTPQPESALIGSDIFVLSSRYEGFPNALLEAMACGLPAISFDCESGPRDIIRPEIDGLLVPPEEVDALARAMARLISDAALRTQLAAKASEVVERFSSEKFFARWTELLG
jgi:glycosyltransferase involved in cell wall biosynthesis